MRPLRRLLAFDVAPETSDRVRRWVGSPLGCLVLGGVAAGLCGLAVHPRVFALAGGLLAVAAAGVCWPWLSVRGVRAAVRFDRPRCTEGDEVGATAAVTNHLPWPAWGLAVRDAAGPGVRLPAVGGRAVTACRWVFVPPRRGVYPVAPAVETAFPFGLWMACRPAAVADRLTVWPRTYPVGPVPTSAHDETSDGTNVRGKVGGTGDLFGVRPYRRGDSPRRIHWGQSAKHDRLVVCELQATARPVVVLVLDTDPAVYAGDEFEWAVRVTASLAAGWLEAGAQVGLSWAGNSLPPRAGRDQAARLLDALAVVAPTAGGWDTPTPRAGVRVVVSTARRPLTGTDKWVVLAFAGVPPAGRPPWLLVRSPVEVADRLRHGTAEATHGS